MKGKDGVARRRVLVFKRDTRLDDHTVLFELNGVFPFTTGSEGNVMLATLYRKGELLDLRQQLFTGIHLV
jgi:hypothetical protein